MKKILVKILIVMLIVSPAFFKGTPVKAAALVDTGLLVRYYIDEAASGITPTTVTDTSGVGTAMNLDLNYGAGVTDLEYTEVSGNRGLDSKDTAGNQRADKNIAAGDKVYDGLHGSDFATVEMVVQVDACTTNNSRTFVVNGRAGDNPIIGLSCASTTDYRMYFNEVAITTDMSLGTTKMVLHLVYDTSQATAANRLLIYKDGVQFDDATGTITQDFGINMVEADTNPQLIMLNRESSGTWARSIDGILYYAAIYNSAFSQSDITNNYDILSADDDTPVAAVSSPTRKIRLFEGFKIKFISGRIILHRKLD